MNRVGLEILTVFHDGPMFDSFVGSLVQGLDAYLDRGEKPRIG